MTDNNVPQKSRAQFYADERREMEQHLRKVSSIYATQVQQLKDIYGGPGRKNGLDQLTKILMGIAMAVQSGTESGIDWAITRALNHGGTPEQIQDAIDVALLNGGVFVFSNARFAHMALAWRSQHMEES